MFYSNNGYSCRFWDIQCLKSRLWNPSQGSVKVTSGTIRDLLLTFHSNHGPISYCFQNKSYRFRDKQQFPWKTANFSHPVYFAPPLKGFPWELGIGAWVQKKLESWGYRAEKEVWRYLQPSGYNTRTWRIDGHRRQQRPRLLIASRGKKRSHLNRKRL